MRGVSSSAKRVNVPAEPRKGEERWGARSLVGEMNSEHRPDAIFAGGDVIEEWAFCCECAVAVLLWIVVGPRGYGVPQ